MNNENLEPIFMFKGSDPDMLAASTKAQASFKYFWRELSWEKRRIVPGLGMAAIKLPFTDGTRIDGKPDYEHMWANDVEFDGTTLSGVLLNAPNWLVSIEKGARVKVPFSHLEDWMMTYAGKAYGSYTVNVMRSKMSTTERKAHDEAWGLDFGDPLETRVELETDDKKAGMFSRFFKKPVDEFQDHPMCVNMLDKYRQQLESDDSLTKTTDDRGWTLLHSESLAGNFGVVRLLVKYGADPKARTNSGKDPAGLAASIGWHEIASYLSSRSG